MTANAIHARKDDPNTVDRSAQRRRLEADMMIAQADRNKLVRQLESLEVERRAVKNDIERKEESLEFIDEAYDRLKIDLQRIDNELARFRRQMNVL